MKEIKFTVTDPLDKSCDMRKLLALMGMAVKQNDEITVQVEGDDEAACAEAIEKFLKENF